MESLPENIRQAINKTATFLVTQDPAMEEYLRQIHENDRDFSFLFPDDKYHYIFKKHLNNLRGNNFMTGQEIIRNQNDQTSNTAGLININTEINQMPPLTNHKQVFKTQEQHIPDKKRSSTRWSTSPQIGITVNNPNPIHSLYVDQNMNPMITNIPPPQYTNQNLIQQQIPNNFQHHQMFSMNNNKNINITPNYYNNNNFQPNLINMEIPNHSNISRTVIGLQPNQMYANTFQSPFCNIPNIQQGFMNTLQNPIKNYSVINNNQVYSAISEELYIEEGKEANQEDIDLMKNKEQGIQ